MELDFKDHRDIEFKKFISESTQSKDIFSIYYDLIMYKICLGNSMGNGHIILNNNRHIILNNNKRKKELYIEYSLYYTNFKGGNRCNYYDIIEIGKETTKEEGIEIKSDVIDFPLESIFKKI